MKLYEILYREIATDFINGKNKFTQKELAKRLGISIGNVNRAVKKLEDINAVTVNRRSFYISALDRLLLFWASQRKLERDIVYRANSDMRVAELEGSLPNGIAFTAYTAYKKLYNSTPADYSEVYVYATADALLEIKRRFKGDGNFPNLIVLQADRVLAKRIIDQKVTSVPVSNVFVDLWNIKTWYAKEFVDALSKRLFG